MGELLSEVSVTTGLSYGMETHPPEDCDNLADDIQ